LQAEGEAMAAVRDFLCYGKWTDWIQIPTYHVSYILISAWIWLSIRCQLGQNNT
jgi:hypothetical protein